MRVIHFVHGHGDGKVYKDTNGDYSIEVNFDCGETVTYDYNYVFTKELLKLANPNDKLPISLKPIPPTITRKTSNEKTFNLHIATTTIPKPSTTIAKKPTSKPDLSDILKLYIADFNQKQLLPFVVKKSIPIVWFGDIDAYFESSLKIVTIGLNPSEQEFMYNNGSDMIMLPANQKRFDDIDFTQLNADQQVEALKTNLNNYFNKNPYKWFNKYDKLLKAKNGSYYSGARNTAIHIDLFSAIATTPTWGKLNKKQKSQIENKNLFLKLLEILNPDFCLCSVNNDAFAEVFRNYQTIKQHDFNGNNYIRVYQKNGSDRIILNGTNMQGTPWGGIQQIFSNIIVKTPDADCENCKNYLSKNCGGLKLCEKYEPVP